MARETQRGLGIIRDMVSLGEKKSLPFHILYGCQSPQLYNILL